MVWQTLPRGFVLLWSQGGSSGSYGVLQIPSVPPSQMKPIHVHPKSPAQPSPAHHLSLACSHVSLPPGEPGSALLSPTQFCSHCHAPYRPSSCSASTRTRYWFAPLWSARNEAWSTDAALTKCWAPRRTVHCPSCPCPTSCHRPTSG